MAQTNARNHAATHVTFLGLRSASDRSLLATILGDDYVFVTNNGVDFRALYRAQELHPGLVVILPSVPRDDQLRLFLHALAAMEAEGDLTNKLVEVAVDSTVTIAAFFA